jgi:hypothetical protein
VIEFNLLCVSCQNPLLECGSVLGTYLGLFVVCETCRTLYHIEIATKMDNTPLVILRPAMLEPEEEFDIIRYSDSRISLKEYLAREENEERNINPHFQKDLKSAIDESITPSDLIRKINNEQ